ncbi:MAG: hypothetical protein GX809_03940, partial [Clostridiaceae bacterium]|nr:hypothetical protein [Clostridiaceae bacterium]
MRHLHDTILVIDTGGSLARTLVHAIRDQQVYCEVISLRRFLVGDIHQPTLRGIIIAGEKEEISSDAVRQQLDTLQIPFQSIGEASFRAKRKETQESILSEFL